MKVNMLLGKAVWITSYIVTIGGNLIMGKFM